jgi:hypothetical protein
MNMTILLLMQLDWRIESERVLSGNGTVNIENESDIERHTSDHSLLQEI